MRRFIAFVLLLPSLLGLLIYQACHISYLKSELEIHKKIFVHDIKTLMQHETQPTQLPRPTQN